MSNCFLSVDITFHDTVLVNTNGSKDVEGILVAGVDTVKDEGDDNLLPGRTTFVPELRFLQVDNVTDVLHDTVKSTGSQDLVFIVVGDGDQKLGVSVIHGRTEVVAIVQGEIVRIASGSGI